MRLPMPARATRFCVSVSGPSGPAVENLLNFLRATACPF